MPCSSELNELATEFSPSGVTDGSRRRSNVAPPVAGSEMLRPSGRRVCRGMSRLVVIASLKEGKSERARELLERGPPFDLDATHFNRHGVHVTDREVVFVFEGPGSSYAPTLPAEDAGIWKAAQAWRDCLEGQPRIARTAFFWERIEGPAGVSFAPTPGPGDSDGGDVYSP